MGDRCYLYVNTADGYDEIGEAKNHVPVLWKILLAEASAADPIRDQRVFSDADTDNLEVPLPLAVARAEQVLKLLSDHPLAADMPQLPRYAEAARQHLQELLVQHGETATISGSFDELSGWHGSDEEEEMTEGFTAELQQDFNTCWKTISDALTTPKWIVLDAELASNSLVIHNAQDYWRGWQWEFGLSCFEHPYFSNYHEINDDDFATFNANYVAPDYGNDEEDNDLGGGVWRFQIDGLWGLRRGQSEASPEILPPQYQDFYKLDDDEDLYSDLLAYQLKDQWGVIHTGHTPAKILTPAMYDEIWCFSEGIANIQQGEFQGLIDIQGREITLAIYQNTGSCRGGAIPVQHSALWGLLNKDGSTLLEPQFLDMNWQEYPENQHYRTVQRDSGWGLISATGQTVIACDYDKIEWHHNLNAWQVQKGDRYALLHLDGSPWLALADYEFGNWLVAQQTIQIFQDQQLGLIDTQGQVIVPCVYDALEEIKGQHGEVLLVAEKKKKYGVLNSTGNILIPFEFSKIEALYESFDGETINLPVVRTKQHRGKKARYGLWQLGQSSALVPCDYLAIRPAAFSATEYVFLVERNALDGERWHGIGTAQGILKSDGSDLFACDYAWIARPQSLTDTDWGICFNSYDLQKAWPNGKPVEAWNNRTNQLECLFADGHRCTYFEHQQALYQAGDWQAGYELGVALSEGRKGTQPDKAAALQLLQEIAEQAPPSLNNLRVKAYWDCVWVDCNDLNHHPDPAKAFEFLCKADELLDSDESFLKGRVNTNLGYMRISELGTAYDPVKAFAHYLFSANLDNPLGHLNVGILWRSGKHGQIDLDQSKQHLEIAAQKVDAAHYQLGATLAAIAERDQNSDLYQLAATHLAHRNDSSDFPLWAGMSLARLWAQGHIQCERDDIERYLISNFEADGDEEAIELLATHFYAADDPAGEPWRERWSEIKPAPPDLLGGIKKWFNKK